MAVAALLAAAAVFLTVALRRDFPYPIHVDEWTHLAYADALLRQGGLPHPEPIHGLGEVGFRPELGFRVLVAEFHTATGLPWETMGLAAAGGLFAAFVVMMYFAGRAMGAGPTVGIMALGTPTTLRFLGPGLLAPVSAGLVLMAALLAAVLTPRLRDSVAGTVAIGLLLVGILLVHPPTAMIAAPLAGGIAAYTAIRTRGLRPSITWAAVAACAIIPAVWFAVLPGGVRSELLTEAGRNIASGQGQVAEYAYRAGYARIAVFAVGVFAILLWRPRMPYLAAPAAVAALLGVIKLQEAGILGASNFYDRSWLYLDIGIAITAGVGLTVAFARLRESGRFRGRAISGKAFSKFEGVALAGLVLAVGLNAWYVQGAEPRYRLVDTQAVRDYRWIRANLADVPGLTLIDPSSAVAYPSLAGRPVYASEALPRPSPRERIDRAWNLLETTAPDVRDLRREGIGIVYRPEWQGMEGAREITPGIFVIDNAG